MSDRQVIIDKIRNHLDARDAESSPPKCDAVYRVLYPDQTPFEHFYRALHAVRTKAEREKLPQHIRDLCTAIDDYGPEAFTLPSQAAFYAVCDEVVSLHEFRDAWSAAVRPAAAEYVATPEESAVLEHLMNQMETEQPTPAEAATDVEPTKKRKR